MEDFLRGNKGPQFGKKATDKKDVERRYMRRPLKTVQLTPPDYKVDAMILKDSFLEKEIWFVGVISDIPIYLDLTNRTDVLRCIDRGKRENRIAWVVTDEHDAVFSISVHNVKISRRDPPEEMILRVAIHDVAATCYIRDDTQHTVAIKFGDLNNNPDSCSLAVLYCDSKMECEKLCALMEQCFLLVYQDAALDYLDSKLAGNNHSLSEYSNSSTPKFERPAFLSRSESDLQEGSGSGPPVNRLQHGVPPRKVSNSTSENEMPLSQNDIIKAYMNQLQKKLNPEELKRFAVLLRAFMAEAMSLPVDQFCHAVFELYGPSRKHLLAGMGPFIFKKEERDYFDDFLQRIGITPIDNPVVASNTTPSHKYRRSVSGTSVYTEMGAEAYPMDEFDQGMNTVSEHIAHLESSVDIDPTLYVDRRT